MTILNTYKQLDVEGGRLFTENYFRLSLTYQFRKGTFARFTYIDDYIRRDPDLYLFEGGSTTGSPLWGLELLRRIDMGDGRGNPPTP